MRTVFISFLIIFSLMQFSFAGGLTTGFGEVLVENLSLGKAYSMKKEAKFPLIITNTSNQKVDLKIELLLPQEGELKPGFKAIPDFNWIRLEQKEFVIEPNYSAKTDVFINIPNEQQYLGKKYQVFIWSHTVGKAIGVGLKSKLLFTICENNINAKKSGHN